MEEIIQRLAHIFAFLNEPHFKIGETQFSLASVCLLLLGLVLVYAISKITERTFERILVKRKVEKSNAGKLSHVLYYFFIALGTLIVFDIAGIQLSVFVALGAIFMVGISFGLQNITQNF